MMRVDHDDGLERNLHYSHKEVLTYFVDVALKEVVNEHVEEGKNIIDDALAKDEDAKRYVTCLKCATKVEIRKRNCTNCKADLTEPKEKAASSSDTDPEQQRQQLFRRGSSENDSGRKVCSFKSST